MNARRSLLTAALAPTPLHAPSLHFFSDIAYQPHAEQMLAGQVLQHMVSSSDSVIVSPSVLSQSLASLT